MKKLTELEMSIILAEHFNYRSNLLVPNVSYGIGLSYEADLLLIRKSLWCNEIEIKCSKPDLIKDSEKRKFKFTRKYGFDKKIRGFAYAVPSELIETAKEYYPEAGLLEIYKTSLRSKYKVRLIKEFYINKNAIKITDKEYLHLLELCQMRMWNLRKKLLKKG